MIQLLFTQIYCSDLNDAKKKSQTLITPDAIYSQGLRLIMYCLLQVPINVCSCLPRGFRNVVRQ